MNILHNILKYNISETLYRSYVLTEAQLDKLSVKITNIVYKDAQHDKKAIEASLEDIMCYFAKTPMVDRFDLVSSNKDFLEFLQDFKHETELNFDEDDLKEVTKILENREPPVVVEDEEAEVDEEEEDEEGAEPAGLVEPGGADVIPVAGVAAPGAPAVVAAVV